MTRYPTGKGYWKHKKAIRQLASGQLKTYNYWEHRYSVREGKIVHKKYLEERPFTPAKPSA